jgi:hypothetical protein
MAIPTTADRVSIHTPEHVNERIKREADTRVRQLAGQPDAIGKRLKELDEEWDIERALEANAASFAFTGTILAATVEPGADAGPQFGGGPALWATRLH